MAYDENLKVEKERMVMADAENLKLEAWGYGFEDYLMLLYISTFCSLDIRNGDFLGRGSEKKGFSMIIMINLNNS